MRKKKKPFGCLYILIVLFALAMFYYWQNFTLQVTHYDLTYSKLPSKFEGFRIVQISDVHGMKFGEKNIRLAETIRKQNPDIVVLTGDMISSHGKDGQAFLDFLDSFDNACPVYMCLGNHEQILRYLQETTADNQYDTFITEVKNRGVILLDNKSVRLTRENQAIELLGLTLELYHYSSRDTENFDDSLLLQQSYIENAIGKASNYFKILLTHNPSYFKEYVQWGADLTLSGHMHGGIVQVPFKGGLLSPERVFFPEYDAGLFQENGRSMIVSRGLGYSQINIRLFNRPEVTVITLKSK